MDNPDIINKWFDIYRDTHGWNSEVKTTLIANLTGVFQSHFITDSKWLSLALWVQPFGSPDPEEVRGPKDAGTTPLGYLREARTPKGSDFPE